ncbi:MAG TPA: DUF4924 family protein [Crocinitomix sp.]|nr:DUF4924 family protein [Crocinitomix sp.]
MLVAKKTKDNNIAEHVLYMFQIEDLIRANNFDLDTISNTILKPQIKDKKLYDDYKNWYKNLIKKMKQEGVEENGHLSDINEILMELLMLHDTLLNILKDKKYAKAFEKALPALKDFQQKSNSSNINIIEVAFNALYSKLILGLKGQKFTPATEEAFKSISNLVAHLAAFYKKMKSGDLVPNQFNLN